LNVNPSYGTTALNPLNTKLNPICHLLALLGAHHILHVSRIRANQAFAYHVYFITHYNYENFNNILIPCIIYIIFVIIELSLYTSSFRPINNNNNNNNNNNKPTNERKIETGI
jgi:hypothetical protein